MRLIDVTRKPIYLHAIENMEVKHGANLRVPQAADYLGLSKSFLDKARGARTGPAYAKLGATIIYSTDDLDAWVRAHRVAAGVMRLSVDKSGLAGC